MRLGNLWLWQSVAHLKKMHLETIYSNLEFSGTACANFLLDHMNHNQFIQVDERGIMLGEISPTFFGDDLSANDVLIYIRPEFRREGLAQASIESFFSWAESRGARLITIGQSTGSNSDEFKALINKLNLQPLGAVYGRLPCVAEK
jgi:GNAT superfamily N-acetyltransferase